MIDKLTPREKTVFYAKRNCFFNGNFYIRKNCFLATSEFMKLNFQYYEDLMIFSTGEKLFDFSRFPFWLVFENGSITKALDSEIEYVIFGEEGEKKWTMN